MKNRLIRNKILEKTAVATLAAATLCGSGQLSAQAEDCDGVLTQVNGKIFNNAQAPGGALSTLGVVSLNGDSPIGKMKCGIVGVSRSADEHDLDEYGQPLPLLFNHTISCDDKGTLFHGGPATHSQLTFHTKGTFTDYPQVCPPEFGGISAPFIEYSAPITGSGRGIFTGTTKGLLTIKGTINCAGTIDMSFEGEICLPQ
jgi:hypothetical protein